MGNQNDEQAKHLNIETVTPDTDDGQPNDQKHNHRIKDEAANADHKETEDETNKEPVDKSDENQDDAPVVNDNDEGSDIETVSP